MTQSSAMECPDEEALDAFARGVDRGGDDRVERHLAQCALCRRVVAVVDRALTASRAAMDLAADRSASSSTRSLGGSEGAQGQEQEALNPGTVVGRYLLLEPIGRGGMGEVHAAWDPELGRRVALKLVRRGAAERSTADVGERARHLLLREAKALAQLDHPNIVQIFEVVEHGRALVIAMEFIEGTTLHAWQSEPGRAWAEILGVYLQAGEGLAAAHAAGLVHRDFKPHNVMIDTLPGGSVRARVLDFGLVRADERTVDSIPEGVVSRASSDPRLTRTGTLLGTPAYMSPEQFDGVSVTAAADQFSYCVALWEGLYGRRPFEGKSLRGLAGAVARGEISEPPRSLGVPARVHRALIRGLAPAIEDRWPSMGELLRALRPQPPVRRSRWLGAAVAVGTLGLAGAGLWAWEQSRAERCSGAAQQIAGVWGESRRQQVEAGILETGVPYAPGVLQRTIEVLDRYAADWQASYTEACEATTVRGEQSSAVMDLRMGCLDRARVELDAFAAVLADADADVVQKAHQLVAGLRPLSRCQDVEALRAEVEPPLPEEVAAVEQIQAILARLRAQTRAGRAEAAQAALDDASAQLAEVEYGPVHTEAALAEAELLGLMGRYGEQETVLRRALGLATAGRQWSEQHRAASSLMFTVGSRLEQIEQGLRYRELVEAGASGDPRRASEYHGNLGSILITQGKYEEAEQEVRRALALQAESAEPDPFELARLRSNLVAALRGRGHLEEAEEQVRSLLRGQLEALGPDHPEIARYRGNLAVIMSERGRLTEAEEEFRRALAMAERLLGPVHVQIAIIRTGLGLTYVRHDRFESAEVELRRALTEYDQTLGPDHPSSVDARANLATLLLGQGRVAEAEVELRRTLELAVRARGPEHMTVGLKRVNLANALMVQGKHADATVEFREAQEILEASLGPEHPTVVRVWSNFSAALVEMGQYAEAEALARRALEAQLEALGPHHHHIASTRLNLANAFEGLEQYEQAKEQLEQAIAIAEPELGAEHHRVVMMNNQLASMLVEMRQTDEAIELAEAVLALGYAGPERADTAFVLARALWTSRPDRKQRARAEALARSALEIYEELGGPRRKLAEKAREWIEQHGGR